MAMSGVRLEQRHGKARVRVGRVWKEPNGRHRFVEWNVSISLLSDCIPAYTHGQNFDVVATDTMKNTVPQQPHAPQQEASQSRDRRRQRHIIRSSSSIEGDTAQMDLQVYMSSASPGGVDMVYVKAKECKQPLSVEDFAIVLGKYFTSFYQQVTAAIINIVEKPWERIYIDGQPHEHGFKLGSEKHTTEVIVRKSGGLQVISGIEGLAVLKTTQSGFEGFIRDKYTILPETQERMLATEVTASWRYPFETLETIPAKQLYFLERYMDVKKVLIETFFGPPKGGVYSPSVQSTLYHMAKAALARFPDISSVKLKMPNLHFLPVNLSSKDNPVIVKFEDDVYLPTDEPHGSIEASLTRTHSRM